MAGGHRSHPLPHPVPEHSGRSRQEVGTYRHLHLKVISVEPEGELGERPLEEPGWPQDEDKLQVCGEGRLRGHRPRSVWGPHAHGGPWPHASASLGWSQVQTLHSEHRHPSRRRTVTAWNDCVTWLVILKVKSSDLLGNYTQYPVIAYKGRECKDVYSYTQITESLCCTSETNTTL